MGRGPRVRVSGEAAAVVIDPLRGHVTVSASEVFGYLVSGAILAALLGLAEWTTWRAVAGRSEVDCAERPRLGAGNHGDG